MHGLYCRLEGVVWSQVATGTARVTRSGCAGAVSLV